MNPLLPHVHATRQVLRTGATLREVAEQAMHEREVFDIVCEHDAEFDGGEFSEPLSELRWDRNLEDLADKTGYTVEQITGEINRIVNECEWCHRASSVGTIITSEGPTGLCEVCYNTVCHRCKDCQGSVGFETANGRRFLCGHCFDTEMAEATT